MFITMRTMTRKRSQEKGGPGRAREVGKAIQLGIEITPEHDAALKACMEASRQTKRVVIELAIEAYARSLGHWPPK